MLPLFVIIVTILFCPPALRLIYFRVYTYI